MHNRAGFRNFICLFKACIVQGIRGSWTKIKLRSHTMKSLQTCWFI